MTKNYNPKEYIKNKERDFTNEMVNDTLKYQKQYGFKLEKEIDAQIQSMNGTMPTNGDMQRESMINGGVVYVHPYTRSDGTEVKGYYRSR